MVYPKNTPTLSAIVVPEMVVIAILVLVALSLPMLVAYQEFRVRTGYRDFWDTLRFLRIRRVAKRLVHQRFKEIFEEDLAKLEVSVETAVNFNVQREISRLRGSLLEPLPRLRSSAHWLWTDEGWEDFLSPHEPDSPTILFGRRCHNDDCRLDGHRRCRFSLDSVLKREDFTVLCADLRSRLDILEREWRAWESDESSFREVSTWLEKNPQSRGFGHGHAFAPGAKTILISARLRYHIDTALESMTTAQRVVYRHTLRSGSLYERLSRKKDVGSTNGERTGIDFHIALVSRSLANYAYLDINVWLYKGGNAITGDDLDMEVFLMLWAKSSQVMPLAKIASAARALVRGERSIAGSNDEG